MKLILTFILALSSFNLFPSGSTVGNGFRDPKEGNAIETLCTSKGGKIEKDLCLLKDKKLNLKELQDYKETTKETTKEEQKVEQKEEPKKAEGK